MTWSLNSKSSSIKSIGLAGVLLLTMTSCATEVEDIYKSEITSNDYVLVLNSVPQSNTIANGHKDGSLFFFKDDGTFDVMKVEGIDRSAIKWIGDQVYFSDQTAEYIVNGLGVTVRDRLGVPGYPSDLVEGFQNNIHLLDDGKFLSFYNTGSTEEEYISNVIVGRDDELEYFPVEGYFEISASCGDSVVGVTKDYELNQERLKIIYPQTEDILGLVEALEDEIYFDHHAVCVEDSLIYRQSLFVDTVDENETFTRLIFGQIVIWDITTGEKTVVPMLDAEGNELILGDYDSELELFSVQKGSGKLNGDNLMWVSKSTEEITIMKSDIKTGVTEKTFSIASDNSYGAVVSEFTEDRLYVLDIPNFPNPGKLRFLTIDLRQGKIVQESDLSEIHDYVGEMVFVRDFAWNPNIDVFNE